MKSFKQIKEDWQLQKRLFGVQPVTAAAITTAFSAVGGFVTYFGGVVAVDLIANFSRMSELGVVFQGGFSVIDMTFGLGLSGIGALGVREFVDCLRSNPRIRREITRENAAGQTVKGPMWVLSFLQDAQSEINRLTKTFNSAALTQNQQDRLQAIIDAAKPLQKEVTIVNAGTKGAGAEMYEFLCEAEIKVVKIVHISKMLKDSARVINDKPDDNSVVRLPLGVIRKN